MGGMAWGRPLSGGIPQGANVGSNSPREVLGQKPRAMDPSHDGCVYGALRA